MYTVSISFGFYDLCGSYSKEIGEYDNFKDAIEAFHNTEIFEVSEYKNFIKDIIREIEDGNDDDNTDHEDDSISNEDDNIETDEDREELFDQLFMYSLLIEKDSGEEIVWYDDWQRVRGFDENSLTEKEIKLLNDYGF